MAFQLKDGARTWSCSRDAQGQREYKVKHLVFTDDPRDGPQLALDTFGLPQPGDVWQFDNDLDVWAYCRGDAVVTPLVANEPNTEFEVEQVFSTKPLEGKCGIDVQHPLCELPKISGRFVKYVQEARYDRFGKAILNSSFEPFHGPQIEFDRNRPSVRIEQNVVSINLAQLYTMVDTVNDRDLWGLPPRWIKLSGATWDKKYYGPVTGGGSVTTGVGTKCADLPTCSVFYVRVLDFEIDPRTFDRDLLDHGAMVLRGHWDPTTGNWVLDPVPGYAGVNNPDPKNPAHFIRMTDRRANLIRGSLNGGIPINVNVEAGGPAGTVVFGNGSETYIHVEKYPESNFLELNIPADVP